MSLVKMAKEVERQDFQDTNLFDKTVGGALIGLPGSAAYGTVKATTANAINPVRWNPKKARRMALRTTGVGTALTVATSPVRSMFSDAFQGVGEEMMKAKSKNIKNQRDHDEFRELSTSLGAGATVGMGASALVGPKLGGLTGALTAKNVYLNEALETKVRRARERVMGGNNSG